MSRKLISKVRHVLETNTNRSSTPLISETINLSTDTKHFERFLQSIRRTNSLLDARRMKNDLVAEIRRTRSMLGAPTQNLHSHVSDRLLKLIMNITIGLME